MSTSISLEIVVDAEKLQSHEALLSLIDKLANFEPVLSKVGKALEAGLLENFDTQGGGSWPALAPKTLLEKSRKGLSGDAEVEEGKLKAAVTQNGAPGHICTITDNSVTIGVDTNIVPYAATQNDGDPAKGIPPRILVQVGAGCIENIIDIITEWLGGGSAIRVYATS
jgi:hypothetical protein